MNHPAIGEYWLSGNLSVISKLETITEDKAPRLEWHISVSRMGRRASDREARRVLRAFGMLGAEEDNHHPGNARNFWLTVDPALRKACECKIGEETVVEPDGYRWQNSPSDCRGCELERMLGRSCSLHSLERKGGEG